MAPVFVPLFALIFAALVLTLRANSDADAIEQGRSIAGYMPWRAEPVTIVWKRSNMPQQRLPGCKSLIFLGEGKGRVVLFDSKTGTTHRINSEDVELVFPEQCLE